MAFHESRMQASRAPRSRGRISTEFTSKAHQRQHGVHMGPWLTPTHMPTQESHRKAGIVFYLRHGAFLWSPIVYKTHIMPFCVCLLFNSTTVIPSHSRLFLSPSLSLYSPSRSCACWRPLGHSQVGEWTCWTLQEKTTRDAESHGGEAEDSEEYVFFCFWKKEEWGWAFFIL